MNNSIDWLIEQRNMNKKVKVLAKHYLCWLGLSWDLVFNLAKLKVICSYLTIHKIKLLISLCPYCHQLICCWNKMGSSRLMCCLWKDRYTILFVDALSFFFLKDALSFICVWAFSRSIGLYFKHTKNCYYRSRKNSEKSPFLDKGWGWGRKVVGKADQKWLLFFEHPASWFS